MLPVMDVMTARGGNRLRWPNLPASLRARVEAALGSPVRTAENRDTGFSPGLASVLTLADGRSVFAKAVSRGRNPDSYRMHRREAEVLAQLPSTVPAPRLLWSDIDDEWVTIVVEAVAGTVPRLPWCPTELRSFVSVAERLVVALTPSPVPAEPIQQTFAEAFSGWRTLAGAPESTVGLDPWVCRHLERLAALEAEWPAAATGTSLLHGDLRGDNVLLTADRGAVVVDWPSVCVGAGWVDLVCALPSIAMQGGGDPEEVLAGFRPAYGVPPEAITAVAVAVTGLFLYSSRQPPPLALPRLRGFQAAQAEAGLSWLRRRLGRWEMSP